MISTIILAHYKEREHNLKTIVDALFNSSVKPDKVIVFIDNPEIEYQDKRVNIVRSDTGYPVFSRYHLGVLAGTDYVLLMDDDLMVGRDTIKVFQEKIKDNYILGIDGNILAHGDEPYTRGKSISGMEAEVDVLIRVYFTTPLVLANAIYTKELYGNELPKDSVDDIILCLSNTRTMGHNFVIKNEVIELDEGKKGQQYNPKHYENRNLACKLLR